MNLYFVYLREHKPWLITNYISIYDQNEYYFWEVYPELTSGTDYNCNTDMNKG